MAKKSIKSMGFQEAIKYLSDSAPGFRYVRCLGWPKKLSLCMSERNFLSLYIVRVGLIPFVPDVDDIVNARWVIEQ